MTREAVAGDLMMFYGSLQKGERPYDKLNLAQMLEFVGDCTFRGDLRDMGWYPACVPGDRIVHGGIYRVLDAAVVGILDQFERFDPKDRQGSLYLRIRMQLLDPDIEVWIYMYNQDVTGRPVVESGHWLQHKRDTNKTEEYGGS